ncbi:hypothetical protein EVJ58_g2934 [Rhodofomes roseus]|uniref:Uncharacterized protein n=1 Tax=Rhodofomes roseus TaxID=34475 RepID=A0A4Y9YQA0_9APHY|nr:hypothetical protein EVJ58_g2934 [Rhodofomes roseus]
MVMHQSHDRDNVLWTTPGKPGSKERRRSTPGRRSVHIPYINQSADTDVLTSGAAHLQEQEQLAALRSSAAGKTQSASKPGELERDFEGGFGGQEDLEDRYATTSGEH